MSETLCLDGVKVELDVDRVEVDLQIPQLEATCMEEAGWERCTGGEAMEPVARFKDGTVIYFHCAAEGEPGARGYRVESPHPHRWAIELGEQTENQHKLRVATLHVQLSP